MYTATWKDLGKGLAVFLDETLSWKDHVEYVSSKVSSRLGLPSRIRACLTMEASKQVYTSLVQPLYDYADSAWGEISEGCCKELQRLENRAARIILHTVVCHASNVFLVLEEPLSITDAFSKSMAWLLDQA